MRRVEVERAVLIAVLAHAAGGCELVLGDLPTPIEDLTTTTESTPSTGGGGIGGQAGTTSATTGTAGSGGATTSSSTSSTTSTTTSTGGEGGGCCDCDGDGYDSEACGGDDCDDGHKLAHPGQPDYFDAPSSPENGFDWDCDDDVEYDPTMKAPLACALLDGLCAAKEGFIGTVPLCGQLGQWGKCTSPMILQCVATPQGEKKMACK